MTPSLTIQINVDAADPAAGGQVDRVIRCAQLAAAGDAVEEMEERAYIRGRDHGSQAVLEEIMATTVESVRREAAAADAEVDTIEEQIARDDVTVEQADRLTSAGREWRVRASTLRHCAELIEVAVRRRQREARAADAVDRIHDDAAAVAREVQA